MSTNLTYAELSARSNFSFLEGAAHPDELVLIAKALQLHSLAITDRNSVAGVVRAHVAAKEHGLRLIPACRLHLTDGAEFLAYPTDRAAWGRLTHLLTLGKRRAEKGDCILTLDDLAEQRRGLILALVTHHCPYELNPDKMAHLKATLGPFYLAISPRYDGQDERRIIDIAGLCTASGLPPLASNDILYHEAERRPLADILTCIRQHHRIDTAGYALAANAERFLKPAGEMIRLFKHCPDAISNSLVIANTCTFSLDELRYDYPSEPVPAGETAQSQLTKLARRGADWRYPDGVPDSVRAAIDHELHLIAKLGYAPYFLTVYDIVHFARSRKILCQGRGSAANSVVCYCLGITAVDPTKVNLLFERFISEERGEPPDIDVDFEHNRREEVIQYIYARYGRHRAALAATLITYRPRSAIRDVGKAMGLSEDTIGVLAGTIWGHYAREIPDERILEAGLDPADPRLRTCIELARELMGFPRHLSQHVGGFVLTDTPLSEIVPIHNAAMADRTVIEWDKDDIDALKILKVDVLALGMLSALAECFKLLYQHHGQYRTLATLPVEDPATYQMLQQGDSIGVFQVESRAQMSMLPRLKPRAFYDLVVQVAIVRPGPIQGDMVHPYLRRRQGKEAIIFPKPHPDHGPADELEQVLGHTYGVPLFQEQAMKIAIVAAGFTPGDADGLRRAMATFRRTGSIGNYRDRFINGMTRRGYDGGFAESCFKQIEGFADYGFPESHAASFALLVYASSWFKWHYPALFTCALLNAQPMGFYAPAQLVRDAREHGVEIRPVDINHSSWNSILEAAPTNPHGWAIRLGFRQIKGLREDKIDALIAARGACPYNSLEDIQSRSKTPISHLERLADADAFTSLRLNRRQALWHVRGLHEAPDLPLFTHSQTSDSGADADVNLPTMALGEEVASDYQTLRLSLKAHPCELLRPVLRAQGAFNSQDLSQAADGAKFCISGLVLVRQRPGSAKGVCFITLEDEFGVANIVIWEKLFERHRKTIMQARLMMVRGKVQREDGVIHVVARDLKDWSADLLRLSDGSLERTLAHADEVANAKGDDPRAIAKALAEHKARLADLPPNRPSRHPRNIRNIIPKARNFH